MFSSYAIVFGMFMRISDLHAFPPSTRYSIWTPWVEVNVNPCGCHYVNEDHPSPTAVT